MLLGNSLRQTVHQAVKLVTASGVLGGIPTPGFFLTAYTHLSDHK